MSKSNLLIKEPPLVILPSLAQAIGLNEAIIVQQLHYWLDNPKAGVERNGHKWIFNTYAEWQENFPFWSVSTIQRIFSNLEKQGLIISAQLDAHRHDQTKFYRLDYDKLCMMDDVKMESSKGSDWNDDNKNTETTTKTTKIIDIADPIAAKISELKFPFNPNSGTIIQIWKDDFADDVIIRALEMSKGKSINYADKILIGWKANGIPPTREEQIKQAKGNKSNAPTTNTGYSQEPTEADMRIARQILVQQQARAAASV